MSCLGSQSRVGESTMNEIPTVKGQESGGKKNRKTPTDAYIFHWSRSICVCVSGPCHEDFACVSHQEHSVQVEKGEESGMKIAKPWAREKRCYGSTSWLWRVMISGVSLGSPLGLLSRVVVQLLSHVHLFVTHGLQHTRLPCPSLPPRVCSNSSPLSQWCRPTISFSVIPFSSCPQSSPASGGQSIGASSSASVLPMNIKSQFPLGLTGLISLLSKELWRIFSSTTVLKHQLFGTQLPLWSNFHIHTRLLEKP